MQPIIKLQTVSCVLALCSGMLSVTACTKTPQDKVGVGEQPADTPERNPGTLPTAPGQGAQIKAAESPEDIDSPGTTRTPPAPPAETMDNPAGGMNVDAGVGDGGRAGDAG